MLAPFSTVIADPSQRLAPPGAKHLFGTDENGIDVLSRLLAAPRTDVTIALVATALSVAIGAGLGVFAGYFEGSSRRWLHWGSEIGLRFLDILQAFPVFILAMVLVAVRGTGPMNVLFAVAFVNFPVFLRLVRSEVLSLRERPFAEAAQAIGNSDLGVCFRHLLPNAWPNVLVQVSVTVGFAILLTAGLSFVGAGVSPPTPELGSMIASGAKFMILGQWWVVMFPGLMLGLHRLHLRHDGRDHGTPAGARTFPGVLLRRPDRASPPAAARMAETARVPPDEVLSVTGLVVVPARGERPPVLDGIDLHIGPGEILGVVGPPGAGKSVLVRSIMGLLGDNLRRARGPNRVSRQGSDNA